MLAVFTGHADAAIAGKAHREADSRRGVIVPNVPYPFVTTQELDFGLLDSVAVDIDDDGSLDVVGIRDNGMGLPSNSLEWAPGRSGGTLAVPRSLVPGPVDEFVVTELTGDARSDLVVHRPAPQPLISTFVASGNGFVHGADYTPGGSRRNLAVGDFDGDGFNDLAEIRDDVSGSVEGSSIVTRYGSEGDAFGDPVATKLEIPPSVEFYPHTAQEIAAGDVDGDGLDDLVASVFNPSRGGGYLLTLRGNLDRTLTQLPPTPPSDSTWDVTIGDLDDDVMADLVLTSYKTQSHSSMILGYSNGDGTYTRGHQGRDDMGAVPGTVADVDGDGFGDAISALGAHAEATVAFGGIGHVPAGLAQHPVGSKPIAYGRVAVGDFDEDGLPDLVIPIVKRVDDQSIYTTRVQLQRLPDTQIDAAPESPTTDRSPRFEFSSDRDDALFECQLDDGEWDACDSPYQAQDLDLGIHTFRVRARTRLADRDPAEATFTVIEPQDPEEDPPSPSDPGKPTDPPEPDDDSGEDGGGRRDERGRLDVQLLRTRIPDSPERLAARGVGAVVRCTLDCFVRAELSVKGSAARAMNIRGRAGHAQIRLVAGQRGRVRIYPRRRVADRLTDPTSSGGLIAKLSFHARPQ
jgi:hypothetical protein